MNHKNNTENFVPTYTNKKGETFYYNETCKKWFYYTKEGWMKWLAAGINPNQVTSTGASRPPIVF